MDRHSNVTRLDLRRPVASPDERAIAFGGFRLLANKRLLLEGDRPLAIGSRALDILIALLERPGDLVSKEELMRRVWPDTHVVEGNVTVHVIGLDAKSVESCQHSTTRTVRKESSMSRHLNRHRKYLRAKLRPHDPK